MRKHISCRGGRHRLPRVIVTSFALLAAWAIPSICCAADQSLSLAGQWRFQIDPDGSLQTPLLPPSTSELVLAVPLEEERQQVKTRLEEVIELSRTPVHLAALRKRDEDMVDQSDQLDALGKLKRNLESNFDLRLDKEYSAKSKDETMEQQAESEEKSEDELFQRRVQKASPKQAEVFESQHLTFPQCFEQGPNVLYPIDVEAGP